MKRNSHCMCVLYVDVCNTIQICSQFFFFWHEFNFAWNWSPKVGFRLWPSPAEKSLKEELKCYYIELCFFFYISHICCLFVSLFTNMTHQKSVFFKGSLFNLLWFWHLLLWDFLLWDQGCDFCSQSSCVLNKSIQTIQII